MWVQILPGALSSKNRIHSIFTDTYIKGKVSYDLKSRMEPFSFLVMVIFTTTEIQMTEKKQMLWFTQIFKENNDYNEKTIIGFMSFTVMVAIAIADLYMTLKGTPIEIKEYIYTSFMTLTIGSFGVAGLERFSPAAKLEAEATMKMETAKIETDESIPIKECPHCGEPV